MYTQETVQYAFKSQIISNFTLVFSDFFFGNDFSFSWRDLDVVFSSVQSFTESNGTTLSTNWKDVGKGKVETKPPEGMFAKKVNYYIFSS